jgi:hypothetical protein
MRLLGCICFRFEFRGWVSQLLLLSQVISDLVARFVVEGWERRGEEEEERINERERDLLFTIVIKLLNSRERVESRGREWTNCAVGMDVEMQPEREREGSAEADGCGLDWVNVK